METRQRCHPLARRVDFSAANVGLRVCWRNKESRLPLPSRGIFCFNVAYWGSYMAKAKKKVVGRNARTSTQDAIALLKADHRQVEDLFEQFESARSSERKQKLAKQICGALKVHTQIEEEIFYPAFLEATEEKDTHHEAEVEHEGAKKLIKEIEATPADDDYFDARVTVLSEMIKHHVNEEEQRGGMFSKARDSDMDLKALGEQLQERKHQLVGGADAPQRSAARRARDKGVLGRLVQRNRRQKREQPAADPNEDWTLNE